MRVLFAKMLPYLVALCTALLMTLILTPLVREFNRRLGMVDKPDPRRINKVPIPRGGGVAVFLGVFGSYLLIASLWDWDLSLGLDGHQFLPILCLTALLVAIGYVDDKFSLLPKVKLAGQVVVAFLSWWWIDIGFSDIWPSIPVWLDCALTVFWIVGAVNAFNLIDGLDGLASGLAMIAAIGMVGALFCTGHTIGTLFYFSLIGGLLGFLRYNFNPASVFLGDSGSMMLGYLVSVLPLCAHTPDSLLVSIGVPLLSMGVPIFDTSLAILRRTIRRLLNREENGDVKSGEVMSADTDHLHHRILRSVGLNQRKAAVVLYVFAAFLVLTGLIGMSLRTRAGGLYLAALSIAVVVIFRDMARVEIFDMGRLFSHIAHTTDWHKRRRLSRLSVTFYVVADILVAALAFLAVMHVLKIPITVRTLKTALPIRVVSVFGCLVFFRAYMTVWSRAMASNYIRLLLACLLGTIIGSVAVYYLPTVPARQMRAVTLMYPAVLFIGLMVLRLLRTVIRDLFYAIDCRQMIGRKDVSRILVYGAGLRYRAFRRELVRTTAANDRIIVGLLDDDPLLCGQYIGGCKIQGALRDAPAVINELNVDAVVIACVISEERKRVILDTLKPLGVKVSQFGLSEVSL